jgi:pullulanase/glycogen debranching enzyme
MNLRDEVRYELCIRGVSSESDVQTLRKLLSTVVTENVPVDLKHLKNLGIVELYSTFLTKLWSCRPRGVSRTRAYRHL